jgi:tripartite-type tricarboxylate transporter receptor subunit TctC
MKILIHDGRRWQLVVAIPLVAGVATTAIAAQPARDAAQYPNRPVRLVCPFPPGGGADFVTRTLGEKLTERTGQAFVTDNRSGASGTIGTVIVAKSAPDGYTVLVASSSALAVNPALQGQTHKDILRDFAPVSLVSRVPYLLVVHPSVAAKSVADLVRLAKAQPARLNYASSGTGSASHLAMELFANMAGIALTHIPYKGSNPAVIDLVGGQVQAGFNNVVPSLPHVKSGRLRALGVSGPTRSAVLPEVPTIAESGLPGYDALQWYGVMLPVRTPPAIVTRLHAEISAILRLPDVRERLSQEGGEASGSSPAQLATQIETEIAKWSKIVKAANIKAE